MKIGDLLFEKGASITMIKMTDVSKIYGVGDSEVKALNNIKLEINDGDMVSIVGTSGSGKSTLLNIMGLLDSAFDGYYYMDNINVKTLSNRDKAKARNEKLGFVLQDFALIEHYTVKENIMIPFRYSSRLQENCGHKVKNTLQKLMIAEKTDTPVSKLSGGQRQRVAIARAIINDPSVILADEPTGALDSKTSEEIFNIFSQLNNDGKTIIIVTHDLRLAEKCKKTYRISDGKIFQ